LWGIDIKRPRLQKYDLIIDDRRLREILPPPVAPSQEIGIKLEILHAFLDLYAYLMGYQIIDNPKILTRVCNKVYQAYHPIIKKAPEAFLKLSSFRKIDWANRKR